MNYAVVKTGGKQYKVSPGDVIEVEKLSLEPNKSFEFEEVLLVSEDGKINVGTPLVSGIKVSATVVGDTKGEKIRVAKFKAKSRYRRVTGHRQQLTQVKIDAIGNHKAENQSSVESGKSQTGEKSSQVTKKTPTRTARAKSSSK